MDSINKLSSADISHQTKVVTANQKITTTSNTNTTAQQSQTTQNKVDTNFEYEDHQDNEWDIGIGDLIIDLDADIEKSSNVDSTLMIPLQSLSSDQSKLVDTNKKLDSVNNKDKDISCTMSTSSNNKNSSKVSVQSDNHQATLDKGLKMKIKRTKMGNKTSDSKHEIVKSDNDMIIGIEEQHNKSSSTSSSSSSSLGNKRGNNNHKKEKQTKVHFKDKLESSLQDLSCNCENEKSTCSNCKDSIQTDKSIPNSNKLSNLIKENPPYNMKEDSENKIINTPSKSYTDDEFCDVPPVKRTKCDLKDMVDVCIGTSVGTITEPDCLGPCEPGTSVTLEGIVWHESEGGVLAVNVTWRGKTYVGTLIDCTKHDWAPPRFCDSPTEDIESRLQKTGRSKRGRAATNDLLNFTETRSSVHSKLRNGSKVPKQPDKRRKSKDESPSSSNGSSFQGGGSSSGGIVNHQNLNNFPSSQKQGNAKKAKNVVSPCAISPVLIECPEQDCSKKYKHANGLKYHQSHAHGTNFSTEEDMLGPDSPNTTCASMQELADEKSTEPLDTSITPIANEKKSFTHKDDGNTNDAEINTDKSNLDNIDEFSSNSMRVDESMTITKSPNSSKAQSTLAIESEGLSNESSVEPNFFQSKSNSSATKCKKNRKSPPISTVENVRSPAYSDISDDSNMPIDSNNMDKTNSEMQKTCTEQSAGPMMLGNYNHLSYYQPPSFLHSGDHIKSISNTAIKEHTPLDLISKMHMEKGSVDQRNVSPTSTKSVQYQHFPFNIAQANFSFNGDSSFSSLPPSMDEGKDSHLSVKSEKDSVAEQQKQAISIKSLIKLEEGKEIKSEPNHSPQHSIGFSNYSKFTNAPPTRDEEMERYFASADRKRNSISSTNSLNKALKEEPSINSESNQKLATSSNKSVISSSSSSSSSSKSQKDIKMEEKDIKPNKNEGQKPTMETQGPPPPPTNQYYLPYHLTGSGTGPPFFTDHAIYRNMLVPSSYNSPYHLQMARFSSPEDLSNMSRNPANTKALDLLQQHASQYYNTHKIHELNDRANQLAKSPSSNIRLPSGAGVNNSNIIHGNNSIPSLSSSSSSSGTVSSQQSLSSNCDANKIPLSNNAKLSTDKESPLNRTSSPPPQRHHHTHHHTHVFPLYGAPYVNPAVLASQPAVAVINPFTNPPPK